VVPLRKKESVLLVDKRSSNQEASADLQVALHRDLLKVRLTEEILAERYREQEMRTPAHFGSGQEAVAVGYAARCVRTTSCSAIIGATTTISPRAGAFINWLLSFTAAPTGAPAVAAARSTLRRASTA